MVFTDNHVFVLGYIPKKKAEKELRNESCYKKLYTLCNNFIYCFYFLNIFNKGYFILSYSIIISYRYFQIFCRVVYCTLNSEINKIDGTLDPLIILLGCMIKIPGVHDGLLANISNRAIK